MDSVIENPIDLGYHGWGGGSIGDKEWEVLKKTIQSYQVRSIIEIGIGLSTLLMMQIVDRFVGYDTLKKHIEWMEQKVSKNVELRWWDGKTVFDPLEKFDLAFVDGPQGARNRKPSVMSVLGNCKILAMHDIGYIWNDKWRYELDPEEKFEVLIPGGRFSVWITNMQ